MTFHSVAVPNLIVSLVSLEKLDRGDISGFISIFRHSHKFHEASRRASSRAIVHSCYDRRCIDVDPARGSHSIRTITEQL